MERLDKTISTVMNLTRSEARRLIKIGKVFVDGERAKAFDTKVNEFSDITVNGEKITFEKNVYIMMNKAKGVVCDYKGKFPYAVDVLPEELKRKDLFCVGRLDKDTTGLLIITNDGDFSHKVISPKNHIEKCYKATLSNPITDADTEKAKSGMTLSDGTVLMSADIKILTADRKTVNFIIKEGKYHQIKRMAGALDNKITDLHRESIGGLALFDSLENGQSTRISLETALKVFNK